MIDKIPERNEGFERAKLFKIYRQSQNHSKKIKGPKELWLVNERAEIKKLH